MHTTRTFSILSRIEASAACTGETYDVTVMSLSVSSVGSKPLPQGWSPHLLAAGRVFQYPQSDRSLCRLGIDPRTWRAFDFQYPQSDRSLCRPHGGGYGPNRKRTFSILSRIEASAALASATSAGSRRAPFSILSRIEASAACLCAKRYLWTPNFQYPQSDRSLCRPS